MGRLLIFLDVCVCVACVASHPLSHTLHRTMACVVSSDKNELAQRNRMTTPLCVRSPPSWLSLSLYTILIHTTKHGTDGHRRYIYTRTHTHTHTDNTHAQITHKHTRRINSLCMECSCTAKTCKRSLPSGIIFFSNSKQHFPTLLRALKSVQLRTTTVAHSRAVAHSLYTLACIYLNGL